MEKINVIKATALAIIGSIGSVLANILGGWDAALQTLIMFMAIDYVTGLIVAGVFKKSGKSENGALESRAGWKGLCRKGTTLLYILIAAQIDRLMGTGEGMRNAVAIGYIANEGISILENGGLMGIPYPKKLKDAISVLRGKSEGDVNG